MHLLKRLPLTDRVILTASLAKLIELATLLWPEEGSSTLRSSKSSKQHGGGGGGGGVWVFSKILTTPIAHEQ